MYKLYHKYFDMSCKQATLLLAKKQETNIGWYQNIRLYYHLYICPPCVLFKEQIALINKAVSRLWDKSSERPVIETQQFSSEEKTKLEQLIQENLKK